MTPLQYLLPFIVVMFLLLSIMAFQESGNFGMVLGSIVALIIVVPLAAWLHRGQGPSTSEVQNRLAQEHKEAKTRRRTANVASFLNGFRRAPQPAPVNQQVVAAAQVQAISDPSTARALQNLQNLLYTRTLTDEEFQAAKDKLLGPTNFLSATEQIEQLSELHRQGILGDLEFSSAKARILGL